MRIGELRQRCGICQVEKHCGQVLSDGCLCCNAALAETEEQDFMKQTRAVRGKMKQEYREHLDRKRRPGMAV